MSMREPRFKASRKYKEPPAVPAGGSFIKLEVHRVGYHYFTTLCDGCHLARCIRCETQIN